VGIFVNEAAVLTYSYKNVDKNTVDYARTNEIASRTSFVIASVRCSIHWSVYVFRDNPFHTYSLGQSYHQKYKCKCNIKLIYLAFIHCTYIFEKHQQSFLSENYEQTFRNKKYKQCNAHEKHKQSFPNENYNRTRHARATSANSIPPRSL
jgi:hypothetical protein